MTPKAIVDRLEIILGIDCSPRKLSIEIEELLYEEGGLSRIDSAIRAERVVEVVTRIISERAALADLHGTTSPLVVIGSFGSNVAGSAHPLPSDDSVITLIRSQRRHVEALLSAIRTLTFSEFEKFCARTLILMGAASAQITRHAGDQGIDFHGILTLGQFTGVPMPFMHLAHDITLAFAGQAKHYPTRNLSTGAIRELVGAVSLARSGTFSTSNLDIFKNSHFKPCSPIVVLLFTSGGISSGARQLASASGITVKSGDQLAVFLADHGVGIISAAGSHTFDPAAFRAWIAN